MRPRALAWLLLGPVAAWNLVFFVLPVAVMVGRSFDAHGLSLAHYRNLFTTGLYVSVMLTTFETSAAVTARTRGR